MVVTESIDMPASVPEAAATLDRLARLCVYDCVEAGECIDSDCDAGRLSRAVAEYLAVHWIDAED